MDWKNLAITAAKESLQDENACACFTINGEHYYCVYHTILSAAGVEECPYCTGNDKEGHDLTCIRPMR